MPSPPNPRALDATRKHSPSDVHSDRPNSSAWPYPERPKAVKHYINQHGSAVPFLVMLAGQMEILRPTLDGERLVTPHVAGCFTGEMSAVSEDAISVHMVHQALVEL